MSEIADAIARIAEKLAQLRRSDPEYKVSGAADHKYVLGRPRTDDELKAIEHRFDVKLPADYRAFLTNIGDGITSETAAGAGPGYGLFSVDVLEEMGENLTRPFPLNHSILQVVELSSSDDYWPIWDAARQRSHDGVLPLTHYGCGIFANMILRGEAEGTVWIIDGAVGDMAHFADYQRYHGYRVADGPHSFTQWYEDWLDASLGPPESRKPFEPMFLPGAYIVPERPWQPPPKVPCPKCGQPLRTPLAKQCFHCGANWHNS